MSNDRKNHLEKFVIDNKQEFNQNSPNRDLWAKIDNSITQIKKPWYAQEVWLWRAASVVLLMVSIFLYQGNTTSQQDVIAKSDTHEFDQVENFYIAQISEKETQISDFQKGKLELDASYEVDLRRLDAMYEVLKEELQHNPSKEVKDALTLNLLIRINLLNSQLQDIEEVKESSTPDQAA